MELQKYRLFVDLAETGNLTRTGERMGYTQSGVSHFLKNLEKEIGFTLFARTNRGLKLTTAGRELLPAAQSLLQSGTQMEETIRAMNGVETGTVTLGVTAGVSLCLVPPIFRHFLQCAPKVLLKTLEGSQQEQERWVLEGRVDMALCGRCEKTAWIPLWEERFFCGSGGKRPLVPAANAFLTNLGGAAFDSIPARHGR